MHVLGKRCKICGSPSRHALDLHYRDGTSLRILQCRSCHIVFVGDPVSDEDLQAAYGALDADTYYSEIEQTTREKAIRSTNDLASALSDGSVLLDVGCGNGLFLVHLKREFPTIRAFGFELPGKLVDECRSKGLSVYTGSLAELPAGFTVCTLLDVAEHVPRPVETFSQCHALLRPDGYLYLHTPRVCGVDRLALLGARVPAFRRLASYWLRSRISIYHLQLWTDKSLNLALAKTGFRVRSYSRELELSWPIDKYVRTYLPKRANRLLARVASFVAHLIVRLGLMRNKAICLAQRV